MSDPGWRASDILPRDRTADPLPLSFAQQRLWFLDQLEPHSPFYNMPTALRLTGLLDLAALHRSLDTVVARHEALRTTFPAENGKPRQVVLPPASVPIPIVPVPPAGVVSEETVLRLATEEAAQPFDLARGPLLRARLLRVGPDEHLLMLVIHHIVSDGWSSSVLYRELSECYRAYHLGESPRLPELPIQYADYAVWQQAWLQGERLERQLGYWQAQLAGVPPVLDLPADRPRPAVQSYRGAREGKLFSDDLFRGLTALGRQEHATLFMVLLAAFHVLLARYTGRRDIVVGAPIAGRTNVKIEGLIGLFVNTLAFRS
ncbi:MAG: non-ribosomal peptide synthetase, partial [Gemmatimonadales bacterium]|nr:non-ribosomal peptide synthetase [Gemmatimonadales bacterium]